MPELGTSNFPDQNVGVDAMDDNEVEVGHDDDVVTVEAPGRGLRACFDRAN